MADALRETGALPMSKQFLIAIALSGVLVGFAGWAGLFAAAGAAPCHMLVDLDRTSPPSYPALGQARKLPFCTSTLFAGI